MLASPAAAAGVRFTAQPAVLPASGGVVALRVDGARSCRISARGVRVPKRACGSVRVHVAANGAAAARRLVFYVHTAHRTIKRVVVEQAQPSKPAAGVPLTKSAGGGAGNVAPAITLQPENIAVPYGSPVTLSAAASGVPAPTLQWQVSANGGATWANTSATFTATAPMNGDSFRAIFTNAAGATMTNPISLTVDPVSTLNFSGYEDYAPAGAQFTSVAASWVVPSVSCAAGTYSYSAEWPGIGDQTSVEQDGTWSDCLNGTPSYAAWFEIYGDPQLNSGYAIALNDPVSAGDQISASVTLVGTTWEFAMTDATRNWTFSTGVASPSGVTLNQGSAEWIVEDPNGCTPSCETLAQFTPVTFSGASATETGAGGTISAFPAAADQIVSSDASTVYAAPGPLSAAGDSFTDTWYAN
ncbi:MAG TPA: G1 family glutamic endopeptidase [Solirubrobacteraceae bacterium]|nr:G1 family glutamic endopeptidase [Solirubrobacteraceae bacterium]